MRAYSNRCDLREQLQRVMVILSEGAGPDPMVDSGTDGVVLNSSRRWSLRS